MSHHAVFIGRGKAPIVIQPTNYKWRPGNAHSWHVRLVPADYNSMNHTDPTVFPLVDSYTKHTPVRPKPTTPYKGSWAESMATLREAS